MNYEVKLNIETYALFEGQIKAIIEHKLKDLRISDVIVNRCDIVWVKNT